MGFFSFFKDTFGQKAVDSSNPGSFPPLMLYDYENPSGEVVNQWAALQQSVVLQCVTILANGVSQIPFNLLKEKEGGKAPAEDSPLYWIFKEQPNKWQSSVDFWRMVMFHLALQGEVVVWKIKVRGKIQQLIPFAPGDFRIDQTYRGGWAVNTYILTKDDSSTVAVPEEDIWHLRWREYGLRVGLPQLSLVRNVVGTAIGGDRRAGFGIKNKSTITGIISPKTQLNEDQRDKFLKTWKEQNESAHSFGKSIYSPVEIGFQPTNMSNVDAQFMEQRKFQIEEICRCWNVNPMLVFSYENNSSYNSTEQMMLQHLVHTMSPWYRLIEESALINLLSEDERRKQKLYFAFNDNALLRADVKARSEFYKSLFNIGAITPNEIRAKEDMPPKKGGDELYVQGAIVPLEDAGKWNNPQKQTDEGAEEPSAPEQDNQSSEGDDE